MMIRLGGLSIVVLILPVKTGSFSAKMYFFDLFDSVVGYNGMQ